MSDLSGNRRPAQVGIVGSGDVALRCYLPALSSVRELVQVAAISDLADARLQGGLAACREWSHGVTGYSDYECLLAHPGLDAVLNLTPVPMHAQVNFAALRAGLSVFSEKPLGASLEEISELIDLAREREVLLLSAPGVAATPLIRWLRDLVESGRLGYPTVATAHWGGLGPADWQEYTGDPDVFYSESVGPLVDQGVYLLHALTALFGPVRSIQAMGATTIPTRISAAAASRGRKIDVRCKDVVLVNLAFDGNRFAQLFSSFAAPSSVCPPLELHFSGGSIVVPNVMEGGSPVDVFLHEITPGLSGWRRGLVPPGNAINTIEGGPVHFVRCLVGLDEPVLTAEHARHVFEVMQVATAAPQSTVEIKTTF